MAKKKQRSVPVVKGPDFAKLMGLDLRDSAHRKIVNRAEDLLEDLLARKPKLRGASLRGFTMPPLGDLAALIALIMGMLNKPPAPAPTPAPVPEPGEPPAPPPPPVKPPVPATSQRFIRDGLAIITGATFNGPLGARAGKSTLLYLITGEGTPAKANQAHDIRYEFDFTPKDQNGKAFGPNDPSWNQPPNDTAIAAGVEDEGQGDLAPVRLMYDAEADPDQAGTGDFSADLSREYKSANEGCDPRIRARCDPKQGIRISNLRFVGPDYGDGTEPANVPVKYRDASGKLQDIEYLRCGRGA